MKILNRGGELIDFSQIDRNYVFMDDNFPPFQLGPLDYPCQKYFTDEQQLEKWKDVNLTHIIVPLYSKIYLDAARARKNFLQIFNSPALKQELGISVIGKHVIRIFLASSRSFKQHISLRTDLPDKEKVLLLGVPLPKFIWVAELSSPDAFAEGKCDGFFVQDATEPGEFSVKSQTFMHSLILGIFNKVIFRQDFGKFINIKVNFADPFNQYVDNLSDYQ
ncbi:hypothetical protein [Flavihumibacter sp. UBA7668]|uniref:hypothetical protein n=1 Tax=Flavihumibacter sp. UBA7668 TaxID=1946542 RepID=UPI0025BAAB96|nr:hypothetical protein [Flavihumibacter sp. UBA7668]